MNKKPLNLSLIFIVMIFSTMLLSIGFSSYHIHVRSSFIYFILFISLFLSFLVFFKDFKNHMMVEKSKKGWSQKEQYTIYWAEQKSYWKEKFTQDGKNILEHSDKEILGYKFLFFFLMVGFFVTLFFSIASIFIQTQDRYQMQFQQKVTRSFSVKGCHKKIHLYEDFRGESFSYCIARNNISLPANIEFTIGFHPLGMKIENVRQLNQ